jgi:hypothetical protein
MNIDLSIVVLYLVVTLGFGIWSGRGVRTIREFAVDNGKMSTWALYATISMNSRRTAAWRFILRSLVREWASLGVQSFCSNPNIEQKRKISNFPHYRTIIKESSCGY